MKKPVLVTLSLSLYVEKTSSDIIVGMEAQQVELHISKNPLKPRLSPFETAALEIHMQQLLDALMIQMDNQEKTLI